VKRAIIIVLSLFVLIQSCIKNVENSDFAIPHSLEQCFDGVLADEGAFSLSCDSYILDPSVYCDIIKLPQNLKFSEEELNWMPSFCCIPGQKIFYENSDGERVTMTLISKTFVSTRTLATETAACSDPDKDLVYCVDSQRVNVQFSIPYLETDLSLSLSRKMQVIDGNILWGAQLSVTSQDQLGSLINFETLLNAYVNPRDLEVDTFYDFQEQLDLFGTEFKNVYSSSVIQQGTVKIYYNEFKGLIGFVDKQGITWKIIA